MFSELLKLYLKLTLLIKNKNNFFNSVKQINNYN